jgi:hypothetical protein
LRPGTQAHARQPHPRGRWTNVPQSHHSFRLAPRAPIPRRREGFLHNEEHREVPRQAQRWQNFRLSSPASQGQHGSRCLSGHIDSRPEHWLGGAHSHPATGCRPTIAGMVPSRNFGTRRSSPHQSTSTLPPPQPPDKHASSEWSSRADQSIRGSFEVEKFPGRIASTLLDSDRRAEMA